MIDIPLTKYGAAAGLVIALIAYTVAVVRVHDWVRPAPERVVRTDTTIVQEPLAPGDLLDVTTPTRVTEYDTSDTQTQCIEVPTWIGTAERPGPNSQRVPPTQPDNGALGMPRTMGKYRMGTSQHEQGGLTYAITPLMSGSPTLSVGAEQVTLSGYLPSGAGREWTYDIPQDTWGVGLRGDVTAGPWLHATATVGIDRYAEIGPLDVTGRLSAGYGALITDEYRAGPVATTTLRIGYDW